MNLPWDKSYFKVCFYAIFTFICIYIAKNIIDGIAYTFVNLGDIYAFVLGIIKKICSVFSIIIAGFIIAYVLKPVVRFTSNKTGLRKTTSAGVVFMILIIAVVLTVFITLYGIDYGNLSSSIREYGHNVNDIYKNIKEFFHKNDLMFFESIFDSLNDLFYNYIKSFCSNILNISKRLAAKAVTLLLSVVVAFYMLRDEDRIFNCLKKYGNAFISEKWQKKVISLADDIDSVFSGYLKGQLTDGVIMASLLSFGLSVINVPLAVPIGLFSGFSNIIPYFGSIIGFALSVGMALVSGEPVRAIYAALLIICLQQIDTIFIVPKIVGDSVKLSPVMVIISLAVAGKLFGIVGMIFAVPTVGVVKLRLDRYCVRRDEYGKTHS